MCRQITGLITIALGGLMFLACAPGAPERSVATPATASVVDRPIATPAAVSVVERPIATPAAVSVQPRASDKVAICPAALAGVLQNIGDTPASPYLVHHPSAGVTDVPTVIFIPGGAGLQRNARRAWESYLSDGEGVDSFRIIIPYSADNEFLQEFERTFVVLDEVLACYGGDPEKVHVAGVSNGGLAAFALMLQRPERFATLLGAPGEFPVVDSAAWRKALAGRAVFNGVGELDDAWKPEVKETHDALLSAGIDSNYVEFPGQGHTAKEGFDKSVLFDFWIKRS